MSSAGGGGGGSPHQPPPQLHIESSDSHQPATDFHFE